jgi:thiamine-monophosphate kinase
MKLGELGEFGLIERIRARTVNRADVIIGIGDDATELEIPPGHRLHTSTDLLIESVHFDLDWTSPHDLGRKAVAVNLSDLAAMAATPRFLYLGLACSADTEVSLLEDFLTGVLTETEKHGVSLVGGDTCHSPGPMMISVTVEGTTPAGQAVTRRGARPGDIIMVSGTLGDSALALKLLQQGHTPPPELSVKHHCPEPQLALGTGLAGLATAMIDISDGLTADLEHILQGSEVNGVLDTVQLPLSKPFRAHLQADNRLIELALAGGEDYELLFTVPAERTADVRTLAESLQIPVTAIGTIQAGPGRLFLRDANGAEQPNLVRGYDHFCPSGNESPV